MSIALMAHIGLGTLAVLLGAIAAFSPKGGKIHVTAGRWFVLFMVTSSLLGAVLGLINFKAYFITFFAGVLAVYLVLSGWLTARNKGRKPDFAMQALGLMNLANFSALAWIAAQALSRADGQMFGFPGEDYVFLAGMSAVGLVFDASLLFRKTLSNRHRIARHLWRMALGFFIAAGSAFTGPGGKIFPPAVQDSGVLALPELIIFVLMIYYLIRTLMFPPRAQQPE